MTDVMALARSIYDATPARYAGNEPLAIQRIALALQAYGDERAREGVSYEAAGNALCQVLEAERARCEQIVDAVRDEQRRIADARVAQAMRELGGFAPADKHSWMKGWG